MQVMIQEVKLNYIFSFGSMIFLGQSKLMIVFILVVTDSSAFFLPFFSFFKFVFSALQLIHWRADYLNYPTSWLFHYNH